MERILNNIQNNLLWWIAGAVAVGLSSVKIFGGFGFTSAICLFAALIMIYPSLVPLDFGKLKYAHKNVRLIGLSLVLNFIVAPSVAFFLGYVFLQSNPALWIGLMLISLLPGGGMATTWALKSKADMPTVVGIIFSNLVAAVFIVPVALSFMLRKFSEIQITAVSALSENGTCAVNLATKGVLSCSGAPGTISPLKIIIPIVFIVVVPLVLAYFTQTIVIKKKGSEYFAKIKPIFARVSNFGLVAVLLVLMGLKSNEIIFTHPELIFISALPLVLFYLVQLGIVMFIYKNFYKDEKGRSLVWGSYLRYITLALGLATSLIYQNAELSVIVVIVILAYFVQIPISFWIAKYFKN